MPLCLIENSGNLITTADPVETCEGYILQTTTEYLASNTNQSIFGTPDYETMLFLFRGGFMTVMLAFMISFFYAAVLEWFNDRNEFSGH